MATSDKFFIIEAENRVVGVEEVGMEDHFNSVGLTIEQLDATNLVQDGISGIVRHVVGGDRWERVSLESEDATFEQDAILLGKELIESRHDVASLALVVPSGMLEQAVSDAILDISHGIAKLFGDSLTLEGIDRVRMSRGRHNDERDHSNGGSKLLQACIKA